MKRSRSVFDLCRRRRRWSAAAALLLAISFGRPAAAADNSGGITVELNKLEANGKSCHTYIVIGNTTDVAFPVMKFDLIFFRPDAVIDRRLAVELGPVRPMKKSVKTFDLEGLSCDNIGSVLVNDIIDCRDTAGPVADCLARITLSSRAGAPFTK